MNRLIICFFLLATGCLAPEPTPSSKAGAEIPNAEAIEAQAQAAASASKPRKEHHALEALVGQWQTRVVTVDQDDAESDPHPGRAVIESMFGGRYLHWEAMLELAGETHVTTGYIGFDANQGEYQLLMISDLSTGMGVARGRGELKTAGIRFVIEIPDPATGALRRAVSNLRVADGNHFVIDQFGADANGRERVVRRTHYDRIKK